MRNEVQYLSPDFRKMFEASPSLYLVLLPDFTIVGASDAYLTAAMAKRENILGQNFFEAFPENPGAPGSMVQVRGSLEKVLQSRMPDTMAPLKYDIPRPEAEGGGFQARYWGSVNTPVMGPTGEVAYIIRRVEDMTKLVFDEKQRKTLEEERDLFFAYSFDLLAIVGSDGYFRRVNPAFKRMLGYSEEEFYSKPIVDFLHPDDVTKTKKGIQTLASGTPTIASQNRYRCKDGVYKWFSWNTTPMGALFYSVGRDITAQMENEERIRQLNLELSRKNEDLENKIRERVAEFARSEAQVLQLQKMDAIGRLAGGIAHDFNNILGAVSMYCDLLSEDVAGSTVAEGHVEEVRQVTTRAAALTRQLLIFSRKQIVQFQTIDLNPLIQQLEKMLARLIGENIKIATRLAPDLRPISADPSQLEQVIMNLVVNAKDALPQGGAITLETSNVYLDEDFTSTHLSVSKGNYVLFSVSDNGSGMDAATVSQIFEPFFTTKPVGKGTGLGLSTTYGIVKQCRGTIWVYSELGKGTVFKIYLPVVEKTSEQELRVSTNASIAPVGTQTVLLVEDDESLRAGFSRMLNRKGYKVIAATSERDAIEHCERNREPIHLLLTDVMMPEISGFELAKRILVIRPELRVLYMSGYASDSLESSGIEGVAQLNFIEKPFNTSTLLAKVQEVLNRKLKN